jgi:hypothetical protein
MLRALLADWRIFQINRLILMTRIHNGKRANINSFSAKYKVTYTENSELLGSIVQRVEFAFGITVIANGNQAARVIDNTVITDTTVIAFF